MEYNMRRTTAAKIKKKNCKKYDNSHLVRFPVPVSAID